MCRLQCSLTPDAATVGRVLWYYSVVSCVVFAPRSSSMQARLQVFCSQEGDLLDSSPLKIVAALMEDFHTSAGHTHSRNCGQMWFSFREEQLSSLLLFCCNVQSAWRKPESRIIATECRAERGTPVRLFSFVAIILSCPVCCPSPSFLLLVQPYLILTYPESAEIVPVDL